MTEKILRIYFDNCCYNRPYDDQSQIRISLEAQAKIFIQNAVRYGKIELATSYILAYENNKNPHVDNRISISNFINDFTSVFIDIDQVDEVILMAAEIMQSSGLKEMDASHIACAIKVECDYFLTTDDRVLKYHSDKIKIMNPIEFLKVLEVTKNVQHY